MHVGQRQPILQVAHLDRPVRLRTAEEALDVVPRDVGEVSATLVGRDPPRGPHRAQQRAGQGTGTDAGLHHVRTGEDVGQSDDRRGVLGVDHRGPARHRQHEVTQQGAQDQVGDAGEGGDHDPLGLADEVIVGERPLVGVELLARDERERVVTALRVGQLDEVPRLEGPVPVGPGCGRRGGVVGAVGSVAVVPVAVGSARSVRVGRVGRVGRRVRVGHGLTLCGARGRAVSP